MVSLVGHRYSRSPRRLASRQAVADEAAPRIDADGGLRAKSRLTAAALGLILGAFGAHRFYLGYTTIGVCQVLVTLVTLGVGCLWGVLEGGLILAGAFACDARGQRLAFGVPGQATLAAAGSVAVHLVVLGGGWWLSALGMLQFAPPPSGKQSIELTASIAQTTGGAPSEPAPPIPVSVITPPVPLSSLTPTTVEERTPRPIRELGELPPSSTAPHEESAPKLEAHVAKVDPPEDPPPQTPTDPSTKSLARSATKSTVPSDTKAEPASAVSSAASTAAKAESGAKVDSLPQKTHSPPPTYPPAALAAKLTGRVIVRLKISAEGRVVSASVYRSSGHAILDEAALKAVRQWRFEPARRGGIAVETEVAAPVRFELDR